MDFLEAIAGRPALVLGLDPRPERHGGWAAFLEDARALLRALAGRVAAVKPQLAFFEAEGRRGMAGLFDLVEYARELGLPVLFDAKRGDVPSTAAAYARAWLSNFPGSALTVNPLLGEDSLLPFFDAAGESGGMVFLLARTSNPGARDLLELKTEKGPLWAYLLARAEAWNGRFGGRVGAVVGATHAGGLEAARARFSGWILAPGVGAQGGEDPKDPQGALPPLPGDLVPGGAVCPRGEPPGGRGLPPGPRRLTRGSPRKALGFASPVALGVA